MKAEKGIQSFLFLALFQLTDDMEKAVQFNKYINRK